jgi:hypothetical protein
MLAERIVHPCSAGVPRSLAKICWICRSSTKRRTRLRMFSCSDRPRVTMSRPTCPQADPQRTPPKAFTDKFVADKFGEATTYWRKLEDRVHRGVGNPCPPVLPDSIVAFQEGKAALAGVVADEDAADGEDTAAERCGRPAGVHRSFQTRWLTSWHCAPPF